MPWQILTATSGKKTLDLLDIEDIDLIINDFKMPKMHGIDLMKKPGR